MFIVLFLPQLFSFLWGKLYWLKLQIKWNQKSWRNSSAMMETFLCLHSLPISGWEPFCTSMQWGQVCFPAPPPRAICQPLFNLGEDISQNGFCQACRYLCEMFPSPLNVHLSSYWEALTRKSISDFRELSGIPSHLKACLSKRLAGSNAGRYIR